MIDSGDVAIADLGGERRHRVLVLSNRRFNRLSDRLLVAPEDQGPRPAVVEPWSVEAAGAVFAIDLVRSIPVERILDVIDGASVAEASRARRALATILS